MNDEQLAMAIGNAVLDAIKTYQPEPKIERVTTEYMSPKELAYNFGKSRSTIHTLTSEIREWVERGRYPSDSVLEGCGILVRVDVFTDYIQHRKALKDPVAAGFVEEFGGRTCRR